MRARALQLMSGPKVGRYTYLRFFKYASSSMRMPGRLKWEWNPAEVRNLQPRLPDRLPRRDGVLARVPARVAQDVAQQALVLCR